MSKEKYAELREKLDAIEALIQEANKFATEHKLSFGLRRSNTERYSTLEDERAAAEKYGDTFHEDYAFEHWVGSEVCW